MKGLVAGIFLGVGIGLLLAPQSGQKTRRFLNERWQELLENDVVKQYLPALSIDLSQALSSLNSLAQAAFSRVNDSTLNDLARNAVDKMVGYQESLNGVAKFSNTMQKKAHEADF
jgi:gas vesicle protein